MHSPSSSPFPARTAMRSGGDASDRNSQHAAFSSARGYASVVD